MRKAAVLHLLLAITAAHAPIHHRPESSTILWRSVPPSVYEVRRDAWPRVIVTSAKKTVLLALSSIIITLTPTDKAAVSLMVARFSHLSVSQILYNHETLVTTPKVPLKGVVFVLTSCDTFVLEWGLPSPSCTHCMGKPHRLSPGCMPLNHMEMLRT